MQTARVISQKAFTSLIDRLIQDMPVIGPAERRDQPGFFRFRELEASSALAGEYVTTTLPPKTAFFAPVERLFTFGRDGMPHIEAEGNPGPFVLLGVHPCDLAAIESLDAAYAFPPAEVRWGRRRKQAIVIGMECRPDSYCFCTSMGTADARAPADLFLTPLDGEYLAEVHSPMGWMLLGDAASREALRKDLDAAGRARRKKKEAVTAGLSTSVPQLADMLDQGGLTPVWREIAGRCYSCGSCNTTCPTCFCFSIEDELDSTLNAGFRRRSWDACQLRDFARVAGGHNFRGQRWQRVRHRWHRKFLYLYRRFGRPYCTGCGRCSRACTADINIVDATNRLVSYFQKERTP
jgi:sulfhydrogenase subunit beta (sulfur reductase)